MSKSPEIIDRGRGPQLSNSRITVQDLIPYLQTESSDEEIQRAMPILTKDDIRCVKQYVERHRDEVFAEDRRIREENASQKNSPHVERILQEARAARVARMKGRQRSSELNGEGHPR